MGFLENIRLAFTALAANKMRSLLTMLGIIIGISAVITITTIGNSIQKTLANTFNQFNMNVFYLYINVKPTAYEDNEDFDYSLSDDDLITDEMVEKLLETYPEQYTIAMSEMYSDAQAINENKTYVNTSISGITDGFLQQGKIDIIKGRNISQRDNKEKKHTAVVSDIFVKQYFHDGENPLGKTVSFTVSTGESHDFTIVGVYEYSESKLGAFAPGTKDEDKSTPVYIPLNTEKKLNPNSQSENGYTYLTVMWNTDNDMSEAENNITQFFEEQYKENKQWTVYVENEQSVLSMVNNVINVVTVAISVIAAISLIVGGVGVMNIMLVSIVERTKEIGVRKALGAQNSSIRLQFVTESIIICLIGGIIGIILGIINGVIIGKIAAVLADSMLKENMDIIAISIQPSLSAIAVAVVFSMLTGIFFGYYPANKAAKMNPIDALRYE